MSTNSISYSNFRHSSVFITDALYFRTGIFLFIPSNSIVSRSNKYIFTLLGIEVSSHGGIILSSRSSIVASAIIVVIVFAGVGSYVFLTNQYIPPDIAVVTVNPGFGDLSMADQVDLGLHELSGDLVVNYEYRIAADQADAQTILEELANSGLYELIIAIGADLAGEVQAVASSHPSQLFGLIGGTTTANNVISAIFFQYEAAFLAGALAAMVSVGNANRSGIVGIIGSVATDPTVQQLIAGFKQGLIYANTTKNLNVTLRPEQYVGSYNNSEQASLLAYGMFNPSNPNGDATVIFAPVRASILGIREGMELANQTWFSNIFGREPFIIAAESDQDYIGLPDINTRTGYSWVLTSVVPRSDLAVYRIINATMWNDFSTLRAASPLVYNLANGGVNITNFEFINPLWTPTTLIDTIVDYRAMILNGTIVVQDTWP
jgi:basic membrane lipoprotein Med (substrate-binding protein (PBP1-ABC) superfamily)